MKKVYTLAKSKEKSWQGRNQEIIRTESYDRMAIYLDYCFVIER